MRSMHASHWRAILDIGGAVLECCELSDLHLLCGRKHPLQLYSYGITFSCVRNLQKSILFLQSSVSNGASKTVKIVNKSTF